MIVNTGNWLPGKEGPHLSGLDQDRELVRSAGHGGHDPGWGETQSGI